MAARTAVIARHMERSMHAYATILRRPVFTVARPQEALVACSRLRTHTLTHIRAAATSSTAEPSSQPLVDTDSEDPPMQPSFARPAPADVVSRIVAGVAADERDHTHTLAVLCDNEAGVLSRVASTLSARGFNIESLTVSPTNLPELSRMTVVMKLVSEQKVQQALKQLSDIANVWACVDYTHTNSLTRELVMVKVAYMGPAGDGRADVSVDSAMPYAAMLKAQPHRAAVRDIGELFGAEVVDVGYRHIIFQLTSWSRRIDAFIRMLEPWGIIEVARSGVVAMLRSPVSGTETNRIHKAGRVATAVSATDLPPG